MLANACECLRMPANQGCFRLVGSVPEGVRYVGILGINKQMDNHSLFKLGCMCCFAILPPPRLLKLAAMPANDVQELTSLGRCENCKEACSKTECKTWMLKQGIILCAFASSVIFTAWHYLPVTTPTAQELQLYMNSLLIGEVWSPSGKPSWGVRLAWCHIIDLLDPASR